MSKQFADCAASLVETQEPISDKELDERLRSGDQQIMNKLPELLQPRLLRRAYQYIRDFRHVVPAYLEAFDLVQEASMVILKRLEEAHTKDSPLAYLVATGYQTMRYLCLSFFQEPHTTSLDRPFSEDDDTPLHEHLSTSLLQSSPYEQEETDKYEALYQAVEQLPELQRIAIEHAYGLGEHAASRECEMQRDLCWSAARVRHYKHKGLISLILALHDNYPYNTQETLLTCIPDAERKRLEQVYARLQAQSQEQQISLRRLQQEAKVRSWAASAYLQAMERESRLSREMQMRQKLDRAYAALQARGEVITRSMLQREAGVGQRIASAYLDERIGPLWRAGRFAATRRRLSQAYADMLAKNERVSISALSRAALVDYRTARAYLRQLAQQDK